MSIAFDEPSSPRAATSPAQRFRRTMAAVPQTVVEMRQSAVASSKSAAIDLVTLPFRAASDWLHWLNVGDQPDSFGKRAGSKVWFQPAAPAPGCRAKVAG